MSNVLQEFLVKLRYQAEGRENYLVGMKGAESAVFRLGKALAVGGTALGMYLTKYAARMEQVGFVARRTGSHVKSLMALEQTGASLGSSAEGAKSALESLAKFMNTTPGANNWLHGIGVQTKDAKGHALDTVQVMKNLAVVLQKMPVWKANQFAQVAGIDYNMMMAMHDKSFVGMIGKFEKPLQGAHLDQTAAAANQAMIRGRVANMKFEAAESKLALPALKFFNKIDDETGGLSTVMLKLAKILGEVSIAATVLSTILKPLTALGGLGKILGGLGGAGKGAGTVEAEASNVAKGGFLKNIFRIGMKGFGIGSAAVGGWELGKELDKKIPMVHQLSGEVAKFAQGELKNLGSVPIVGSALRSMDLLPDKTSVVRAYGRSVPASPQAQKTSDSTSPLGAAIHNMSVTINVQGAKDPSETARKVKEELRMAVHNSSMAVH